MVIVDFNAKSPSWLGTYLRVALLNIPNILLNLDSPAHYDGNALDLSFVSTNLAFITECRVGTDTYGSGHFPTIGMIQHMSEPQFMLGKTSVKKVLKCYS